MRKVSEIIGLPVICKKSGSKIATVKEVIYSKKKYRIVGFLVSEGNIFREAKIIQFNNIDSIGEEALIIKNENMIEKSSLLPEINQLINEKKIIEEEILTEDGESLGHVKDTLIDDKNGKIIGFILTDGLIQDIKEGRNVLPYTTEAVFGENSIIISNEAKNSFDRYKEDYKKLLELL
ncbi:PRC-barrel domain-containing protein [Proteiniborus sp. MB09-C3]|uniref:PRC-barrel domain-containing protein n=1 Tax=Proteiniborus sp. MB09-C3 TaxID=3050072 RepID=UPI002556E2AE|nr:PRC-barrel domain-containing protein [Proteiniborus sp. MB09-C3]WIV11193.1 PRC-barrel domain-containing protein [Proteiniborus sp. MB09-C3]